MEKVVISYCEGIWIAQVKERACKLHHVDCAGNGNGVNVTVERVCKESAGELVSDVVLEATASPRGSSRQNFCWLALASVSSFLPRSLPRPRKLFLVFASEVVKMR